MFNPAQLDLTVWRNAPFPDGADDQWRVSENGAPMNLTGLSILMQVRQYQGAAGDPYVDLTVGSSGDHIEIVDAEGGVFVLHISQETLEAMPVPLLSPSNKTVAFSWDLKIGPAGEEAVYAFGSFILVTGVVR